MKENKVISLIGMFGFITFIWGGLILFEPSSFFGSFFGIMGLVMAFYPIHYLWKKEKVE